MYCLNNIIRSCNIKSKKMTVVTGTNTITILKTSQFDSSYTHYWRRLNILFSQSSPIIIFMNHTQVAFKST